MLICVTADMRLTFVFEWENFVYELRTEYICILILECRLVRQRKLEMQIWFSNLWQWDKSK